MFPFQVFPAGQGGDFPDGRLYKAGLQAVQLRLFAGKQGTMRDLPLVLLTYFMDLTQWKLVTEYLQMQLSPHTHTL